MGCLEEWKPVIAMLVVNVVFAVMNTLIKKVIDEGLNQLVLITVRQLVATLFIAPVAYFRERKARPKMTAKIFVYLFFSAVLGASLTQYLFFVGLQYTSATFSCAFLNMVPVFTFLIAIPFRLERVNLRSKAGIAKVLGAAVCLAGAMLLTFYKGIPLGNASDHAAGAEEHAANILSNAGKGKWMMGTIALFGGTFSWASWFLLQSKVGKKYPALYSGTAVIFFLSFLQAAALTFATQRGVSFLLLRRKLEILTVTFAGLVGSGVGFVVMSWCVEKRGPVFTSAFSPLTQIIVAGIDVTILREQLHLGSVLGSVLVIAGLYCLLWGKSKDVKNSELKPSEAVDEIHGALPAV
ncbi:WAT1-related protein-like [Iris pallida]|uniref:WAT1-related protein n=1 Tax=Iris pallida TaxID=29817 RepID=A0AAX6IBD9_IRIPA|nr:WAT1-related protein-like [Iris pallida]KAJ6853849.1 WAT1-related protein-like [Iris pallida]